MTTFKNKLKRLSKMRGDITMKVLKKNFYMRDPDIIARALLGKKLVRKWHHSFLEGIIVETEAYYGFNDPASRAYHGLKQYNRFMWGDPGILFIYNVHNYWMLNIVSHEPSKIGAVLIRSLEPVNGMEIMKKNRNVEDIYLLTSGPGRLTRALQIDKSFNGVPITTNKSDIYIVENQVQGKIVTSHRIGVTKDMRRELRFYLSKNKFC